MPAVVVPHIIGQSFWGQHVHELGVGPRAIPRAKLAAENLAQALTKATHLLPLSNLMGGALFWLALGLGLLVSGLYTLRRYLSSASELPEVPET